MHLDHSPQAPEAESFKHKEGMGQLFSALQSKLTQRDQGLQWEGRRGGRGQRSQHREGDGPARMTESKGEGAARSGDWAVKTAEQAGSGDSRPEPHAAVATPPRPGGSTVESLSPFCPQDNANSLA